MDLDDLEMRIERIEKMIKFLIDQLIAMETARRAKTQALVDLLISKGLFTEKEFENASTNLKKEFEEEVIKLLEYKNR